MVNLGGGVSVGRWKREGEPPLIPGRPIPSASIVRQVNNEVSRVQGGALVQNARLGALDFVSGTAIRLIEANQRQVDDIGVRTPRAEAGCQAIADIITAAAARIVSEAGQ